MDLKNMTPSKRSHTSMILFIQISKNCLTSHLMSIVRKTVTGVRVLGSDQLEEEMLERWWFLSLAWVRITQGCSLCDNPLSCLLIICASFSVRMLYFSKNHTPFPPKRETLALPVIHLLHYQETFRHNEKNLWMLWILILLKLTFASVMSTKINTSILKTFAKETNVFDVKTKNSVSFGKHLLDWR